MKKFILTLFVLVAALSATESQAKGLSPIKFGVKAGMNIVNLKVDNISASNFYADAKNGYHIGVMSRITIGPIYIQPELLYNRNKITYVAFEDSKPKSQELKLSTVDVPVMAGISFLGFMRAGIGVNFTLLDNKNGELINSSSALSKESVASLLAGVGINFMGIDVDARYVLNVKSTNQEVVLDEQTFNAKIARNYYQISLGYMF